MRKLIVAFHKFVKVPKKGREKWIEGTLRLGCMELMWQASQWPFFKRVLIVQTRHRCHSHRQSN